MLRTPQGYLGCILRIAECPIVIRRHMQSLVKIVRGVLVKSPKRLFLGKNVTNSIRVLISKNLAELIPNFGLKLFVKEVKSQ